MLESKVQITIEVDWVALSSYSDEHLAQVWHVCQTNPAEFGDKKAGELVTKVGWEIIRRWLGQVPPSMYNHQAHQHYWEILSAHGKWVDGVWTPNPVAGEVTPDA